MISTRRHGAIDYAVIAALAGLSACRKPPASVRIVLACASAAHLGYAMITDYEAGSWPKLTMRRHLALDALVAATLCGAGLLMRRTPRGGRLLLAGIGLVELAVVASSDTVPGSGPGHADLPVGYAPLDTLKPVAPDVFIVDSLLPGLIGKVLPVRMTVIRLANGDLLLHSPTRYSAALRAELEQLGRIRHLVAPNVGHWTFLQDWLSHVPEVRTWAAPGLRDRAPVRKSGVRLDADLGDMAPAEWNDAIELVTVRGGLGFTEVALLHRPTRTLVLTDIVLNLEASRLPRLMRPVANYLGILAPDGTPPPYVRAVIKLRRKEASKGARRLLALDPARVVFAHGRWFERDGAVALRRSLRWLA